MSSDTGGDRPGTTPSPQTLAAQALGRVDPTTRALVAPLHASTTYERDADGGYSSGRGYTRPHNPTYDDPADLLTALEGGADCLLFSSGMAAATAVFQALLPGDHVLVSRVMYWALRKWLIDFAMPWGLQVEFVDSTDAAAVAAALRPGRTRLLWIETPANPTWDVSDIAELAELARAAGARVAVDSTVATPVLTRPLSLGADLVMHSATKYLNGHSDVLAGALVCAVPDAFWQRIRACHRDGGAVLGPFEAWLLLRGMRTLFVRVAHASASALALARHFQAHPGLSHVLYPGLQEHPGHALAAQQMDGGFSGMLSLRVRGGEAAAMAVAARVQVFHRATSLGGVESLIEHRASIEGPASPVPGDMLRLSIGLESTADLIADLEQALAGAAAEHPVCPPRRAVPEPERAGGSPQDGGTLGAIRRLLAGSIRPVVVERGGDVALESYSDGVLTLRVSGSPAAVVPIREQLRTLLVHHVPEVRELTLAPEARRAVTPPGNDAAPAHAEQVQRILDEILNPAMAAHEGRIALAGVDDGTVSVRLEGRCQGCAMADVTLRQGVEPLLREQAPATVAVVDVTDHAAGTNPWFKTRKA